MPREMASRSANVSVLGERRRTAGTIPLFATSRTEWSHGPCRRRVQSHAATRPPSNDAICRPSAPQKDHTVFLVSSTPPLRNDLNQMVLHRPVETAPFSGKLNTWKHECNSTPEFHKIWIDQCAATKDIRDHFGLSKRSGLSHRREALLFSGGQRSSRISAGNSAAIARTQLRRYAIQNLHLPAM
jgi:hypothetical protein